MQSLSRVLVAVLLLGSLSLSAQFRSNLRTANKEYELNAYNLAIESYRQALASRPDNVEALSKIADSYRMLNQMQTAHTYYQQAVRDRRVEPNTILEHAHVLKAIGRYDEAKQWYLLYARDHDPVVGNHYAQSCDFALRQQGQDAGFVVQAAAINSPLSDFGATTPQPGQFVFNSARPAGGPASAAAAVVGQATNRPYVATVGPTGTLTEAFPLRNGYTAEAGNVGPVSYSPDGGQVIFTRNNFTSGTRMIPEAGISLNLLIADVNPQGVWTNARPLPFNGTDYSTGFGTFGPDGSIYFASNRPEGYGGYDIYRARRQGQTYETVPENMGTVVNSVGHEITPFFDGASLFFSSDWHHGLGTYDVFRAEMNGDRASRLYHMGGTINSNRDDVGFIFDPITSSGYLTSNRIGGSGQEDIYRVGRSNANLVLLVTDASTGQPIPSASIDFTTCGGQVYATDQTGRYAFQAVEGVQCEVVISGAGYDPARVPLSSMQPDATNTVRVSLNSSGAVAGGNGMAGQPGQNIGGIPNGVQPSVAPPGSARGYLTNAQTGYPVMDAEVTITDRATGQTARLRSDQNGAYLTQLNPFTTYDVAVNGYGFEPVSFPITTQGIVSGDEILGNITLLPNQGSTGTGPTYPGGNPTTTPTPGGANVSGYSVQLASLGKAPDLSKFGAAQQYGRVYAANAGGTYKVRVGVFATRAEAEAAANRLKQGAYAGAFVVSDTGVSASGAPTTVPGPPPTTAPSQPVGGTTTNPASTGYGRYRVQLGAFSKPQNFNRAGAQQLGQLDETQRGTLTIFRIVSLQSPAEAEAVRARAESMGFTGAYILVEENGQLRKL